MDVFMGILYTLSHGIPGIVTGGIAMMCVLLGLIRKEAGLMLLAGLLTIPMTYIAGSWEGLGLVTRLLPVFLFISAYAISVDETFFAWIIPLPTFGYLIYVLFMIVVNDFGGI